MTFSLINTWSFGDKFTSAQANAIAGDLVNCIDKTGDTVAGIIVITGQLDVGTGSTGGQLNVAQNGIIQSTANGATIQFGGIAIFGSGISQVNGTGGSPAGSIQANGAGAIRALAANSVESGIAGGISDGGTPGGIAITVASGLTTSAAGGIRLGGGSSDWPSYPPRTYTYAVPLCPCGPATGWAQGTIGLSGPATSQSQLVVLPRVFPGATITTVSLVFAVGSSHSGVPANLVGLSVLGGVGQAGFTPSGVPLGSPSIQYAPTPASGAAWYNSGNTQLATYNCTLANTNLSALGPLYVVLYDEYGTNSISGNQFCSLVVTYTLQTLLQMY